MNIIGKTTRRGVSGSRSAVARVCLGGLVAAMAACGPVITPAPGASGPVWAQGSVFQTGLDWFNEATNKRVWVSDVTGDGLGDLVGIAQNGDVWVAPSQGDSFSAGRLWAPGTIFSTPSGWFDATYWDRVWLADVTGDGAADIVGVANNGDLWVSESTRSSFNAAHLVAGSVLSTPTFFERGHLQRVWLADVSGDGRADVVGIDGAGEIWVSVATGAAGTASFAPSALWSSFRYGGSHGSIFSPAADWFNIDSQRRVWLADVTGDGTADVVGIDPSGRVWVSESTGTAFADSQPISTLSLARAPSGASVFSTTSDPSTSWFSTSTQERVWIADVTGDGKADIVGVAPSGLGDGDVWIAKNTGQGHADFDERVALNDSVFRTSLDWFLSGDQPRVWLADVSGDGRADLVGVAKNGDVWVSKAAVERTSTAAPYSVYGERAFFLPSERVGGSPITDAAGYFSTSTHSRVWLADVTGDGVKDLVAVSSGVAGGDGDILWKAALPPTVKRIAPLTKAMLNADTPVGVTVEFSRSMSPSTIGSATLQVSENGTALAPVLGALAPNARSATWLVPFSGVGAAPASVSIRISGYSVTDRWGDYLDGEGAAEKTSDFVRFAQWDDHLVAGTARVSLDPPGEELPYLTFSSGFGYCPTNPATSIDAGAGMNARIVILAGGGACASDSDCRDGSGQTCVAYQCQDVYGTDQNQPLVLVSVDAVGFDAGRLHEVLAQRYGIAKENVIVAATHAHGVLRNIHLAVAPYYEDRTSPRREAPFQTWMEDRIADGIGQALGAMQPIEIATGVAKAALSTNRRAKPGVDQVSLDDDEQVIKLRGAADGKLVAVLVNYAMHPTIQGWGNTNVDADFPGYLTAQLEQGCADAGGSCVALFMNGGAGDIDPQWGEASNDISTSQYYANALANNAAAVATTFVSTSGLQIRVERQVTAFDQGISSCHEPGNKWRTCELPLAYPERRRVAWDLESTSVVLGAPKSAPLLAFATMPGEPFVKLQLRLKAGSVAERTMLFGYANGYAGYFADKTASTDGSIYTYSVNECDGPVFFDNTSQPWAGYETPGESMITSALYAINYRLSD